MNWLSKKRILICSCIIFSILGLMILKRENIHNYLKKIRFYSAEFFLLNLIQPITPALVSADSWSVDPDSYHSDDYTKKMLKKIIKDNQLSDREKIIRTAHFITTELESFRGSNPAINAYDLPPGELLQAIQKGQTEVYCTHHSRIHTQMALQLGLPTRIIHTRKKGDFANSHYHHTLAETFLPDEKQWALVDLQSYAALFLDKNTEKPLSIIEVIKRIRKQQDFIVVRPNGEKEVSNSNLMQDYERYFSHKTSIFFETQQFPLYEDELVY